MGRLVQVIIIGAAVLVGYRLVRALFSGADTSRFPCASCKNCKTLFDDGVICVYGRKETFKTETHIANCRDYERGTAS